VYLGTLITSDNNISAEINNRITLANRSYFGLVNILKAKDINRKYKVSKADEERLGVFERKILRRIYGPLCEAATWR
jgi:hypothetical protein